MRILIATGLYPPDIGGPATYSKFLEEGLPSYGHTVKVLPFRKVRNLWIGIRHAVFFFLVIRHGRDADLIYAQDTLSVGLPSALASLLLGKRFLVRVPGDHVWEQGVRRFGITEPLHVFPVFSWRWHPYLILMRALQRFVVRAARAVVVPSRYMQGIVRTWGASKDAVILIYNGVEELGDTGNKPVLRGLLKFQGKLLISVGRLVPWKGFKELISVLPSLKKTFSDLKLLVVGSGPMMDELESHARDKSVSNDVIFTGELPRDILIRYVRASDVFVLNSRYEGLSHQILEVMAIGVPVVATDVGGNPEVIEDGVSGYLVPPGNAEKLKQRLVPLLQDSTLRARIVASAKRKVKQFSNARMVKETADMLQKIYA